MTPPKSHSTARSIRTRYRWALAVGLVVITAACGGGDDGGGQTSGSGRGVGGGQQADATAAAPAPSVTDGSASSEPIGEPSAPDTLGPAADAPGAVGEGWQTVEGPGFTYRVPPDWNANGTTASLMVDGQLLMVAVAPAGALPASIVADSLVEAFEASDFPLEQTPVRLANGTAIRLRVTYPADLVGYSYVLQLDDQAFTITMAPTAGGPDLALADAIAGSVQPT